MSDPDPASQNSAPAAESRESNRETQPAQVGIQASGESPPGGKQEATGTERQCLVKLRPPPRNLLLV